MPEFPTEEWFQAYIQAVDASEEYAEYAATWEGDAVIHWRGGAVTRHTIRQGLRAYQSLGGLARLRERVLELRQHASPQRPRRA